MHSQISDLKKAQLSLQLQIGACETESENLSSKVGKLGKQKESCLGTHMLIFLLFKIHDGDTVDSHQHAELH